MISFINPFDICFLEIPTVFDVHVLVYSVPMRMNRYWKLFVYLIFLHPLCVLSSYFGISMLNENNFFLFMLFQFLIFCSKSRPNGKLKCSRTCKIHRRIGKWLIFHILSAILKKWSSVHEIGFFCLFCMFVDSLNLLNMYKN